MQRAVVDGVGLLGEFAGEVRFAFTERTGGVSQPPFCSLNLGTHVGDDPGAVLENRRRALGALMGVDRGHLLCPDEMLDRLLVPNQVHGDHVVVLRSDNACEIARAREEAAAGADAIVCTSAGVPVMLCFADCVPVVLVAPHGFAVIHSGWKGTYRRIAAKAARALMEETGSDPSSLKAYIGPHILEDEYKVSEELISQFAEEFHWDDLGGSRMLNMTRAIAQALMAEGIPLQHIEDLRYSTVRENDRFFSYRAEGGQTGRHAALAYMSGERTAS